MAISRSDMERQLRNMGGIMSLQEPRQGYFLGKLVRKAKKAVKKVVKSPVGKAAILGALTFGVPGTQFGGLAGGKGLAGLKGKLFGTGALGDFGATGSKGLLRSLGLTKGGYGSFGGLTGLGKIAGIGAASGLAGLLAAGEQDEEDEVDLSKLDRGEGLDIDRIVRLARMNDPQFRFLPGAEFTGTYADGGRIGFADGTDKSILQKIASVFFDEEGNARSALQRAKFELSKFIAGKGTDLDTGAEWYNKLKPEEQKEIIMEKIKYRDRGELGGVPLYDEKFAGKFGIGGNYAEGGEIKDPIIRKLKVLPDTLDKISKKIAPLLGFEPKEIERLLEEEKRKRSKKAEGGIMDLGGLEMDLRGGGFVPLGAKEKADDVPARLSKNEFVMTADAVRAAGGGSVDKGADKMYKMMKNLEAQV